MAKVKRHLGWTFVIIEPGETQSSGPFGPPTPMPGSIGVKRLRGKDLWGCWTPWNGHWWDVPRCLLRLYHKASIIDTTTKPLPV